MRERREDILPNVQLDNDILAHFVANFLQIPYLDHIIIPFATYFANPNDFFIENCLKQ
jgi:hypothetical protein